MDNNKLIEGEKLVDRILDNIMYVQENITLDDFKDYLDDLKKKGFNDEKKLQGALDKAKELADKQGKGDDKKTVLGIFMSFFKAK